MSQHAGPFSRFANRAISKDPETLTSFAFELIEDAVKQGGIDDGFELADLIRTKQKSNPIITTQDSQIVLSQITAISDELITADAAQEASDVLGLGVLANMSDKAHLGKVVRILDNDFITKFIENNKFEDEKRKNDFINIVDINIFNQRNSPSIEDLFIALKSGELRESFTVDAVTSLDKETSIGVLQMMTHNSILEMSIKNDDLKTFVGHIGSLPDNRRDAFIEDFLENGSEKHIKFAETYLDFEAIKENRLPHQSYSATALKLGLDVAVAKELEEMEPDLKSASPMYGLSLSQGI